MSCLNTSEQVSGLTNKTFLFYILYLTANLKIKLRLYLKVSLRLKHSGPAGMSLHKMKLNKLKPIVTLTALKHISTAPLFRAGQQGLVKTLSATIIYFIYHI